MYDEVTVKATCCCRKHSILAVTSLMMFWVYPTLVLCKCLSKSLLVDLLISLIWLSFFKRVPYITIPIHKINSLFESTIMVIRTGPSAPFRPPRLAGTTKTSESPARITPYKRPSSTTPNSQPQAKRPNVLLDTSDSGIERYNVQWRRRTNKKNKTWDGDGSLSHNTSAQTLVLKDEDGKVLTKISGNKTNAISLVPDTVISIGMFEVEFELDNSSSTVPLISRTAITSQYRSTMVSVPDPTSESTSMNISPQSETIRPPLYLSEQAIVLPAPPGETSFVEVSIDPMLAKVLRPHQIEGVKFLYECVMGYKMKGYYGALLADEMGLGKTLMSISLIWTLLKQSPWKNDPTPVVQNKVLIVCPVTLIGNWKKEFKKWLGLNRVGVLNLSDSSNSTKDKRDIVSFGKYRVNQILVINYEKLLSYALELRESCVFDLMICDEGHRLKNNASKSLSVINSLNVKRKVMLTGTPIQNDLIEFFTILNFLNPNILGSIHEFQKRYIRPINNSRDVNCIDPQVKKLGQEMSNQLIEKTSPFILRRTNEILSKYLPAKTDIILFVFPTALQKKLFQFLLDSANFNKLIESGMNQSLALITLFKKNCNSPSLLAKDKLFNTVFNDSNQINVSALESKQSSGKINVLVPLLLEINKLGERVVLISNYTQTLDLLESVVRKLNMTSVRLDGSTPSNKRDAIINQFNHKASEINVFLLSSKLGGVGLNLTGASRLILFDNDWNPSVDLQAMARIHRDGQTKSVYIYRLLTVGCMDEKIFQRQLMKNNLSDFFLTNEKEDAKGKGKNSNVFEVEELKKLFYISEHTNSNSHDLLGCRCNGQGELQQFDDDSKLSDHEEGEGDEQLQRTSSWMTARTLSQRIEEDEDYQPFRQRKQIRNSLSNFKHYDTTVTSDFADDSVVEKILGSSGKQISYIMSQFTPPAQETTDAASAITEESNVSEGAITEQQSLEMYKPLDNEDMLFVAEECEVE